MQEVAENLHEFTAFSCNTTDDECTSIRCDVIDTSVQSVGMSVVPCSDPPSLVLSVDVEGDTQSISADGNRTVTLNDVPANLRINIWHFDYSMDVEVSIH